MNPEELLEHEDFVRNLARSLVNDQNSAADITQQTWLAALKHAPSSHNAIRSWLNKVTRNFAIKLLRGEARRAARERAAAIPEGVPSTDEIVALEESRRSVIDAVLSADESYRSVILLRYYHDLPSGEVARRLGIPVETARSRLKRGLAKLREKLDREFGDRGNWCLALAPLVGLKLGSKATCAGVAASTGSIVTGGLIMATKIKILSVAALVIGIGMTLYQVLPEEVLSEPPLDPVSAVKTHSMTVLRDKQRETESVTIDEDRDELRIREVLKHEGLFVSGRVVDKVTDQPVRSFHVRLAESVITGDRERTFFDSTIDQDEGLFTIPVDRGGFYSLGVYSSRHRGCDMNCIQVAPDTGLSDLLIALDPALSVSGRVVEERSGQPLEGVLIVSNHSDFFSPRSQFSMLDICLFGNEESRPNTRTDEKGRFELRGLVGSKQKISALHPDFAEGVAEVIPGEAQDVKIGLKPGFRVFGTAYDDSGTPREGVVVNSAGLIPRPVLTGADGRFSTPPADSGRFFLQAFLPPGESERPLDFSAEVKCVELIDRDVEVDFGITADHVVWRGTLYDGKNGPLPRGSIRLFVDRISHQTPRVPLVNRQAECDGGGCFTFRKLVPAQYGVRIIFPDGSSTDLGKVVVEGGGVFEKDLRVSGSLITGVVVCGESGAPMQGLAGRVELYPSDPTFVFASESSEPYYRVFTSTVNKEGGFLIRGVTPGSYGLTTKVQGFSEPPVQRLEVKQGRDIGNLRVLLADSGQLRFRIEGFARSDLKGLSLKLISVEGRTEHVSLYRYRNGDVLEGGLFLEVGAWTARLSHKGSRSIEKDFRVVENRTIDLFINKNEMVLYDTDLVVEGSLFFQDGAPADNVQVHVEPVDVAYSADRAEFRRSVCTNSEGSFRLEGMKPGRWRTNARLRDRVFVMLPDLVIPPSTTNPFQYKHTLPSATITGELHDRTTGLSLGTDGQPWTVYLMALDGHHWECWSGSAGGSHFVLECVPEGDYELTVKARGYAEHRLSPIVISQGQEGDVGKVELDPCGTALLEVVDATGSPIPLFWARCEDEIIYSNWGGEVFPGRYLFDKLPLGPTEIKVGATGYEEEIRTIKLEPNFPADVHVMLRKK